MSGIVEVDASAKRILDQIADQLAAATKVLVITGAGISTSCGIPDFRSDGGLYSQATPKHPDAPSHRETEARRAPSGKAMFDVSVWQADDSRSAHLKFISDMKRAVQEVQQPSATHRFVKLLRDRRRLVRNYTQNIDGLERRTGLCAELQKGSGSRFRFTKKSRDLPVDVTGPAADVLDGGCEVVPLHGDLDLLRCPVCQETIKWESFGQRQALDRGEAVPCPECVTRNEVRQVAGRRETAVGVLRPNIVLYGEEHPAAGLLEPLIRQDLRTSADVLLILGTSLKVHGLQKLVKEFSKAVHSGKRGFRKVIFVNRTEPSKSMWTGVLDYFVRMDCDEFVEAIRQARPDMWNLQQPLPYRTTKISRKGALTSKAVGHKDDMEDVIKVDTFARPSKQTASAKLAPARVLRELDAEQVSNQSPRNQIKSTGIEKIHIKEDMVRKRKFALYEEAALRSNSSGQAHESSSQPDSRKLSQPKASRAKRLRTTRSASAISVK